MRRTYGTALFLFLLLASAGAAAQSITHDHDNAGDRAALIALYNSTGGDNWRSNSLWTSEFHSMAQWNGVGVDFINGEYRVTELNLGANNMNGRLPREIGYLTKLLNLNLYKNENLRGAVPGEIGHLTKLRYVRLYKTGLTSLPPQIGRLANLRELYLYDSRFRSLPLELGNLPDTVTHVHARNNEITGPLPAQWVTVADVPTGFLDLTGNRLSGPIPPAYAHRRHGGRSIYLDTDTGLCFGADFPPDSAPASFYQHMRYGGMPDCDATPGAVPGAPTGLTLTAGDAMLTARWAAPTNGGGSAITEYRVQWRADGEGWDGDTREVGTTRTSYGIVGLTNGTTYSVRVAAVNAQGRSAWSTEATGVPAAVAVPALPAVGGLLLGVLLVLSGVGRLAAARAKTGGM